MTNTPDQPDDAFEAMARNAGAALRRPAPSDGIVRVQSARRRRQMVRSSVAVGASTMVVVIGLIVLARPSDQSIEPIDSPAASTSTTVLPTTTAFTPPSLSLTYTLSGVDGLTPVGDPQRTDNSGGTSLVAAWSAATGVTDGFLVLDEMQAPEATTPESDVTSVSIDVPDGHAFLVTDNGFESLTSATRVMWWRDDGRLWIVSNFGLTAERLKELTLAIQPGSGLPFVLPDPDMTFVGFTTSASYESVRQEWMLEGLQMTLAVTTGGLAQQLADVVPVSVAERTIAGQPGYAVTLTDGQVNLVWPTDTSDHWGSLMVNSQLAERVDVIAAAITSI